MSAGGMSIAREAARIVGRTLVYDGWYRLHRLEVAIRPENAKSLRVVQKLGLRYEGDRPAYLHVDGAWRDHVMFALTAEEIGHAAVFLASDEAASITGVTLLIDAGMAAAGP